MKSRKPENSNRIFLRRKIYHKLIHTYLQIIRNLNSVIHQNKKIEADIYRKRKYMNIVTVKDAFLQ